MKSRRRWLWAGIAAVAVAAIAAIVNSYTACAWMSSVPWSCARHISWLELGQFNIDAFEDQFRTDLPVGTPQDDVEAYLKREKIPFKYVDGSRPYLWVFKRDAHRKLFWLTGDLSIHIELDDARRISRIKSTISYK